MKKLLVILGAIALTSSSTTILVACQTRKPIQEPSDSIIDEIAKLSSSVTVAKGSTINDVIEYFVFDLSNQGKGLTAKNNQVFDSSKLSLSASNIKKFDGSLFDATILNDLQSNVELGVSVTYDGATVKLVSAKLSVEEKNVIVATAIGKLELAGTVVKDGEIEPVIAKITDQLIKTSLQANIQNLYVDSKTTDVKILIGAVEIKKDDLTIAKTIETTIELKYDGVQVQGTKFKLLISTSTLTDISTAQAQTNDNIEFKGIVKSQTTIADVLAQATIEKNNPQLLNFIGQVITNSADAINNNILSSKIFSDLAGKTEIVKDEDVQVSKDVYIQLTGQSPLNGVLLIKMTLTLTNLDITTAQAEVTKNVIDITLATNAQTTLDLVKKAVLYSNLSLLNALKSVILPDMNKSLVNEVNLIYGDLYSMLVGGTVLTSNSDVQSKALDVFLEIKGTGELTGVVRVKITLTSAP